MKRYNDRYDGQFLLFICALFEQDQGESATKKLKTVLLLRCKLPSDYHGDAIPEACLKLTHQDVMGKS